MIYSGLALDFVFLVFNIVTYVTFVYTIQIIDIERIIMHPKFSGWSVKNDIALIKLKTPAKLTARVQPICLPAKNTRPPVGFRDCYLAGKRYQLYHNATLLQ